MEIILQRIHPEKGTGNPCALEGSGSLEMVRGIGGKEHQVRRKIEGQFQVWGLGAANDTHIFPQRKPALCYGIVCGANKAPARQHPHLCKGAVKAHHPLGAVHCNPVSQRIGKGIGGILARDIRLRGGGDRRRYRGFRRWGTSSKNTKNNRQ